MINSSITPDPKVITKQTGVSKYAASNTSEGAQLFSDRGTLTAASPERHQRVIAKPDEVVTSFRLSGIIGGVMLHDPVSNGVHSNQHCPAVCIENRQSEVLSGGPPRCE